MPARGRGWSPAIAIALLALTACARQQSVQPESTVYETISVTAPADAVRGLEDDLRGAIANRKDIGAASIGFSEGGPSARVVEADSSVLSSAYEDARRKAAILAKAVHATLGNPIAVDEVNAADPFQRAGGDVQLKGNAQMSRVNLPAGGPEIVRVTFALSTAGHGPSSVTVYGLQVPARAASDVALPNHLSINIQAGGPSALQTAQAWEGFVRDAGRKRGVRDGDIRVGNINANVARPR